MTHTLRLPLAFATLLLAAISCAGQSRASNQSPLTEDGECTGQSAIPPDVLKVVLATKEAQTSFKDGTSPTSSEVSDLFRASKIDLAIGIPGLMVCGRGSMTGADNNWYWIVATPSTHPRVVLWEGSDGLTLTHRLHHGYRDIESGWGVAAQSWEKTFHFDGTNYVLATQRCYVPQKQWKQKRVKCE